MSSGLSSGALPLCFYETISRSNLEVLKIEELVASLGKSKTN